VKVSTKDTERYVIGLYNRLEDLIIHKLAKKFNVNKRKLADYNERIRFEANEVYVDDKLFISFSELAIGNPRMEGRSLDLEVQVKIYDT
jgi:hypothetical protein